METCSTAAGMSVGMLHTQKAFELSLDAHIGFTAAYLANSV